MNGKGLAARFYKFSSKLRRAFVAPSLLIMGLSLRNAENRSVPSSALTRRRETGRDYARLCADLERSKVVVHSGRVDVPRLNRVFVIVGRGNPPRFPVSSDKLPYC
jgi:hypothetical protein